MVGRGRFMDWARILAYVTGTVDQELLAQNEYLAAENRILKAQLNGRLRLSDADRATLSEIGHRLGRKGSRRGRNRRAAGHHPGLVPQTGRPQILSSAHLRVRTHSQESTSAGTWRGSPD